MPQDIRGGRNARVHEMLLSAVGNKARRVYLQERHGEARSILRPSGANANIILAERKIYLPSRAWTALERAISVLTGSCSARASGGRLNDARISSISALGSWSANVLTRTPRRNFRR